MACVDWSAILSSVLGWWISHGVCAAVQVWYQGASACFCYLTAHPSHLLFLLLYLHQSGMRKMGITTFFIVGLSASCLPQLLATTPPSWKRLCSAFTRQTLCVCWNQLSFTHVPGEQNRGLCLEALILFSHLVYKCIVPLTLFLMIFKLWRDPGT